MNTLLIAFGMAIAGMNGESNALETSLDSNNSAALSANVMLADDFSSRLDLNNCCDDPDFPRRQLELRNMEFGPLSGFNSTRIG